jgi:hypothetical protein
MLSSFNYKLLFKTLKKNITGKDRREQKEILI